MANCHVEIAETMFQDQVPVWMTRKVIRRGDAVLSRIAVPLAVAGVLRLEWDVDNLPRLVAAAANDDVGFVLFMAQEQQLALDVIFGLLDPTAIVIPCHEADMLVGDGVERRTILSYSV